MRTFIANCTPGQVGSKALEREIRGATREQVLASAQHVVPWGYRLTSIETYQEGHTVWHMGDWTHKADEHLPH